MEGLQCIPEPIEPVWNQLAVLDAGVEVKPLEVQTLKAVECSKMTFELGEDVGGEPPSEVVAEGKGPHVG